VHLPSTTTVTIGRRPQNRLQALLLRSPSTCSRFFACAARAASCLTICARFPMMQCNIAAVNQLRSAPAGSCKTAGG